MSTNSWNFTDKSNRNSSYPAEYLRQFEIWGELALATPIENFSTSEIIPDDGWIAIILENGIIALADLTTKEYPTLSSLTGYSSRPKYWILVAD